MAVPEVKAQKDSIESPDKLEKSLEKNEKETLKENENKTVENSNGDERLGTNDDVEDLVETPEQENPISTVSTEVHLDESNQYLCTVFFFQYHKNNGWECIERFLRFRRKRKRENEMKVKTKNSQVKEKKNYHLVRMGVVATGRMHRHSD